MARRAGTNEAINATTSSAIVAKRAGPTGSSVIGTGAFQPRKVRDGIRTIGAFGQDDAGASANLRERKRPAVVIETWVGHRIPCRALARSRFSASALRPRAR